MSEKRRTRSRVSLLMVQSIVCGVILLLVLILRLIGGETYGRMREQFRRYLTEDTRLPSSEASVETPSRPLGEAIAVNASAPAFCSPLECGTITSVFGTRTDPISGEASVHGGVDVSAVAGTPLLAPYDGVVCTSSWDARYGNYIVIRAEDNTEVLYAHCSALLCREGDVVRAGETVARVGSSGRSTGAHVHIELIRGGERVDPSPLLVQMRDA